MVPGLPTIHTVHRTEMVGEVLAHGRTPAAGLIGDAVTVVVAATLAVAYLAGSRPLRRRPDGRRRGGPLPEWRVVAFLAGTAVAVAALASPAEHLAEEMFAVHMLQHLALAFVAAPMLVLGRPLLVGAVLLGPRAAAIRRPLQRYGVRARGSTAVAAGLVAAHVAPWVAWHLPAAYEWALASEPAHLLEHVTMVLSGAALTWLVVGWRSPGAAVAAIVVGMAAMSLVAATLTFAGTPLYEGHDAGSRGLTSLEDQQVGGALMWFPGSIAYLVAAGVLVVSHLGAGAERGRRRAEHRRTPSHWS